MGPLLDLEGEGGRTPPRRLRLVSALGSLCCSAAVVAGRWSAAAALILLAAAAAATHLGQVVPVRLLGWAKNAGGLSRRGRRRRGARFNVVIHK